MYQQEKQEDINCYEGEKPFKFRHSKYVYRIGYGLTDSNRYRYDYYYYEVLRTRSAFAYGKYEFVKFKKREFDSDIDYYNLNYGFHTFMRGHYGLCNPIGYYTERGRSDIVYIFDRSK